MPKNEIEILAISRLLSPENRANLLAWVHLANVAENSIRKSSDSDVSSARRKA